MEPEIPYPMLQIVYEAGKFTFFVDATLLCAKSVPTSEVLITKGRYEDDDIVIHVHVKGMVLPMNNLPCNLKR